ncbi:chemotaxis protein CheW [Acidisphaera sp. L21]|uniref:hybrid sensor histidine kinase/response regulator n=1 Tax=Acidisphaera sp. L21 TaxID=1641851 RepID=UPI00131C8FD7|nr:chemotaxis protein CheW [Acidisphaera sp. L21]
MDELLIDFLTETAESLAALDDALLQLERVPDDPEMLAVVFRMVHTIKGTCGFLSLPRLERVAHVAEDLLGDVRDGKLPANAALITVVLGALDRIKLIVSGIVATGLEPDGDDTDLLAELRDMRTRGPAPEPEPAITLDFDTLEMLPPGTIESLAAQIAEAVPMAEATPEAAHGQPAQTIRLDVNVLENLMILVSELVLTRNQLMQIARTETDSRFTAPLQRLSHLTSDLQEGVVKTRMSPILGAWNKLPRIVRDLASELGKQIDLVMLGKETELDRQVLELIRDPLIHMVRNSADHGLESPAVRLASGKPAHGTITLSSFHEGGQIVIEVADDGAGLSTERIRARALAQGLASSAELATMTERQVQRFIFAPGFSTASAVTSVSGRGVGMDVVKTNIERLGGTVDLRSVAGRGTTFTVKIPLTLAIISALIVEAGGQRFALPQICVAELVRAEGSGSLEEGALVVERVDGTPVLRLRDQLLPLVNLRDLLQMDAQAAMNSADPTALTVVVATLGGTTLGLVVDQVFDTEEIVVKPVSPMLRHIKVFSGNTILGDGAVIMILDPNGLSRAVGHAGLTATVKDRPVDTQAAATERTGDRSAMLLVRLAPDASPVAMPLGLVARIESIAREDIEFTSDQPVTQYRGQLMPLMALDSSLAMADHVPVLVFADRGRSVGLMVEEIVDVVEDQLFIELVSSRPGLLGTAVIAGRVTEIIDAGHWLKQGWEDWFSDNPGPRNAKQLHLLVVEDSAFFRQLLIPTLSAAGYHVTAVDSAMKALALRDAAVPAEFDAIISDVEMPGMDGLQFARLLKEGGPWMDIPLIALSGRFNPIDIRRGGAAGFCEYLGKFDREALLAALRRHLDQHERQAA